MRGMYVLLALTTVTGFAAIALPAAAIASASTPAAVASPWLDVVTTHAHELATQATTFAASFH